MFGPEISATDANGDTLTFSTGGNDGSKFDLSAVTNKTNTVQLNLKTAQNFEAFTIPVNALSLEVIVSDGRGGSDTLHVTVGVTDVSEPPIRPSAPTVTPVSGSSTRLSVGWSAPANAGRPPITGYNLQYRQGTTGGFTTDSKYQNLNTTTATITNLVASRDYEVQVQAVNNEGTSPFSVAGTGRTNDPPAPQKLGTPSNLRGNGHVTSGKISLQWNAVTNADNYHARYREVTCSGSRCTTGSTWSYLSNVSAAGVARITLPDKKKIYELQIQAANTGGTHLASSWSSSEYLYTSDSPPGTRVVTGVAIGIPPRVSFTTYPPEVATAPLYGHQRENASGHHEFKFIVCEDTIPEVAAGGGGNTSPIITVDDIADAIETWETESGDLVTATQRTTVNPDSNCAPAVGVLRSGDNEVLFADRKDLNLALCVNAPACWRSSTYDWIVAKSKLGLIRGLPKIAEGTIMLWNIPWSGATSDNWNNDSGEGCTFLEHMITHEAGHAYGIGWPLNRHPTVDNLSVMSYAAPNYCKPERYDLLALEANYQSR